MIINNFKLVKNIQNLNIIIFLIIIDFQLLDEIQPFL